MTGFVHLHDYGKKIVERIFLAEWRSHQSLLICTAIVVHEERLQVGDFCCYDVTAKVLIWRGGGGCEDVFVLLPPQ